MHQCTWIKLVAVFGRAVHVSRIKDSGSGGPSWAGRVRVLFGSGGLRAYTCGLRPCTGYIRLDFIVEFIPHRATTRETQDGDPIRFFVLKIIFRWWSRPVLHGGYFFGVPCQIYSLNKGVWTYGELVKKFKDPKMQFESWWTWMTHHQKLMDPKMQFESWWT